MQRGWALEPMETPKGQQFPEIMILRNPGSRKAAEVRDQAVYRIDNLHPNATERTGMSFIAMPVWPANLCAGGQASDIRQTPTYFETFVRPEQYETRRGGSIFR
jgi:hypothetical protein